MECLREMYVAQFWNRHVRNYLFLIELGRHFNFSVNVIQLQIIPRGHLKGKVGRHYSCVGDTWYVNLPEEEMKNNLGI